jgi:hypothetical protein
MLLANTDFSGQFSDCGYQAALVSSLKLLLESEGV